MSIQMHEYLALLLTLTSCKTALWQPESQEIKQDNRRAMLDGMAT